MNVKVCWDNDNCPKRTMAVSVHVYVVDARTNWKGYSWYYLSIKVSHVNLSNERVLRVIRQKKYEISESDKIVQANMKLEAQAN